MLRSASAICQLHLCSICSIVSHACICVVHLLEKLRAVFFECLYFFFFFEKKNTQPSLVRGFVRRPKSLHLPGFDSLSFPPAQSCSASGASSVSCNQRCCVSHRWRPSARSSPWPFRRGTLRTRCKRAFRGGRCLRYVATRPPAQPAAATSEPARTAARPGSGGVASLFVLLEGGRLVPVACLPGRPECRLSADLRTRSRRRGAPEPQPLPAPLPAPAPEPEPGPAPAAPARAFART